MNFRFIVHPWAVYSKEVYVYLSRATLVHLVGQQVGLATHHCASALKTQMLLARFVRISNSICAIGANAQKWVLR